MTSHFLCVHLIFIYDKANWQLYPQLAEFSEDMVQTAGIDEAVDRITHCILEAAAKSIPMTVGKLPKQNKPCWNEECSTAHKDQKRVWDRLRRYPTSENLLRFKRLKAVPRRIRRQSQRASWQKYVGGIQGQISSKKLWQKVNRFLVQTLLPSILNCNGQVVLDMADISNAIGTHFARTSSNESYTQHFIHYKRKEESKLLNFNSHNFNMYDIDFTFHEL
ncbi:putative RNA-directed DNA polymerase from transposon X-element [Caerostris extrusa]|uniref:RNA-directed DNA polymerase from transposon X-element n=1 Tax=Caerostris extrusa TaxID=172846 RepID=A0AAV4Q102_CAEEX|nr:putative RNA-directed DNA polymerase from transposon X-element [Caerostris extrusa]